MTDTIRSDLGLIDGRTVAGYAYDPTQPGRHFVVEILADDVAVSVVRAADFSPPLAKADAAAANHGFVCTLSAALVDTSHVITARLANIGTPVGRPVALDSLPRPDPLLSAPGAVERLEDSTVFGWIGATAGGVALVRALTAGEEIAATNARTWTSRSIGGEIRPVLAFALQLPSVVADGQHHAITVTNAGGLPLAGCPIYFQKFQRGG
jgi:O-antigen biosynthesis protein